MHRLLDPARAALRAYPPALGCFLVAVASLVVIEVSEAWERNTLGFLVAHGLAWVSIGIGLLTLVMCGVARLRAREARDPALSTFAEWLAILALVIAAITLANAAEGTGIGWTNYDPRIADWHHRR